MSEFKEKDLNAYRDIYLRIDSLVEDLADAIKDEDGEEIIKLVNENHLLLSELTKKSKVNIETKELRKMHEIAKKYGAGKLSGAGGGDCGIGVCFDKDKSEKMKKAWQANGLDVIDVKISDDGVKLHA